MKKAKAVFVDRDGVINEDPGEAYYVRNWEAFKFQPGVAEAIKRLNDAGYRVYVVSNQSGIARGEVRWEELGRITLKMNAELEKKGARVDGVFYCPHDDRDACACRKPKPGLFLQAAEKGGIDLAASFNVGDSERDIEAGKAAGIPSILVLCGKTKAAHVGSFKVLPDKVKINLSDAVQWILDPARS